MNNSERTNRAFVKLVDDLTERGIITWRHDGNELRSNVELILEVHDVADSAGDNLRTMIIEGGSSEMHCIDEVPLELLTNQFVEIEPEEVAAAAR